MNFREAARSELGDKALITSAKGVSKYGVSINYGRRAVREGEGGV